MCKCSEIVITKLDIAIIQSALEMPVEVYMIEPLHSWRRCPARPDGDIRPEAILSTSFGSSRTATHRQVTCTCQIWISGWILPHFDVRTISVASKLKKLQIFLYIDKKYLIAPSLIVMVREAVVVSATHGGL